MPDMKVVQLQTSNFRDIASTLRKIADEVESGNLEHVRDAVVVVQGMALDIYHTGEGDVGTAYLLLNCAARKLEHPVLMATGGYSLGTDNA